MGSQPQPEVVCKKLTLDCEGTFERGARAAGLARMAVDHIDYRRCLVDVETWGVSVIPRIACHFGSGVFGRVHPPQQRQQACLSSKAQSSCRLKAVQRV